MTKEEAGSPGTPIDVDDSKLSWNCTSMMEDTQPSDIFEWLRLNQKLLLPVVLTKDVVYALPWNLV